MLHIIGLGLADEKDISVKGLEIVRKAERVYLEAYTAILLVEKGQLVSAVEQPPHSDKANVGQNSRKPTMADPSSSPTARWSSPLQTKS